MSEYTLLGKQIKFTDSEDRYASFVYRMVSAMGTAESEFKKWYKSQDNISAVLDGYLKKVQDIVSSYANNMLFDELPALKIYDIGRAEYNEKCLTISDAISIYNEAVDAYNNIIYELEDEMAYREERKAERGRVVGGGFGLGGALKGMATAGAMNAASGAAHSVANAFGNAISKSNANDKKHALYVDGESAFCEGVTDSVCSAFQAHINILNEYYPNYVCANYDLPKSNALLESAKKVTDDREKLLVVAFEACPWNHAVYTYIFSSYDAERKNLLNIAAQYHVDLSDDVEKVLRAEYTSEAQETEAAALVAKKRIITIMSELGIKDSTTFDQLEQDCIARICKKLESATEEECVDLKKKVTEYDALAKNKEPFFDKIKHRIDDIWTQEDSASFDVLYLHTNILNEDEVKEKIKHISEKGRTEKKKVYLDLFNAVNRSNIQKARRFAPLAGTGTVKVILRNLGYILMALGVIIALVGNGENYAACMIPFWGGVLVAIILGIHRSAWNKLTLNGKLIHPVLTMDKQAYEAAVNASNQSYVGPNANEYSDKKESTPENPAKK